MVYASHTGPELRGTYGMAASTHWLATATAMSVLERGGNAFDAAAAAGFVLHVVQPHQNGPGGEVPAVLWTAAENTLLVLNGQGVAPRAASIEGFAHLGLDEVPGTGLLAATVPGAFPAWMLLLERLGSWTLRDVLEYAIGYARTGAAASASLLRAIDSVEHLFATAWPSSATQWTAQLHGARTGAPLTNQALASTYQRVLDDAEQASATREGQLRAATAIWSSGFVAEEIDSFCQSTSWLDTSGRHHGGLLTAADLYVWQPTFEDPLTFDYGRYTVAKTAEWGQGPVFLQQLAILAGFDLAAMGHLSADYVHTVTEGAKLAFADREAWYGDSSAPGVLADLLAPDYSAQRQRLITDTADAALRPGHPGGRQPRLPRLRDPEAGIVGGVGDPTLQRDGRVNGDTCHLDVVDKHGNMISATPSGGWLQSSPTIPGLGFCLGTRAQMFSLDPGLPNSLAPGKRPRTTLSPGLALRDGQPWLAFGTPGGDQQDQWALHFFLSVTNTGGSLRDALDQPAFHSEHFPSSFYPHVGLPNRVVAEQSLGPAVLTELARRGHDLRIEAPWTLGRVSAVAREQHQLRAAADVRGAEASAAGR